MSTAHARTTDPATSHAAAAAVDPLPSERAVLRVLADGPATDEEIFDRVQAAAPLEGWPDWQPQRIRDARLVMQRQGRVRQVPRMGLTKCGGKCRVWELDDRA